MSRKLSDAKYAALVRVFVSKQHGARNRLMDDGKIVKADGKRYVFAGERMTGKCVNPTTGEPVTAVGDCLVMPVPGSEQVMSIGPMGDVKVGRKKSVKGAASSDDAPAPKVRRSGTCPLCGAHVPLSDVKGAIRSHTVHSEPVPASKALSEPRMDVTDTGTRVGAPETSHKLRLTEIDGAFGRGTVEVPVMGPKGRTRLEEAEATEDNIRAALEYRRTRKPRSDAGRKAQSEHVSTLTRRLEALMDAQTVTYDNVTRALTVVPPDDTVKPLDTVGGQGSRLVAGKAGAAVGGRGHGRSDGSALVQGHPLEPMAGPVTVRQVTDPVPERDSDDAAVDTRTGFKASAGTMFDTAEGTVRPDPMAVECPVTPDNRTPLTRTQRRNATRRRKARELAIENARLHEENAQLREELTAVRG
jgi:hypothetical protein